MEPVNFRELSKQGFKGDSTIDSINCGSLQRIADATEVMSHNHAKLQTDLEWYRNAYRARNAVIEKRDMQIRALKGVITKLKKARNNGN
jgi:hypothetical protein